MTADSKSRPMFPHAWDSTMLAAFRSCPQKAFRNYVEHWKPKAESVHLVAGGAFAKGVEVARMAYFEGQEPIWHEVHESGVRKMKIKGYRLSGVDLGDRDKAEALGLQACINAYGDFECPAESAKSLERTAGALEFYFAQYPIGADGLTPLTFPNGRRAIEFSFAEPLDVMHPITGQPILYTGRCDMIAEFAGGTFAVDEKTTSSLGASWGRQWEMRGQFSGYQWAAQRAGLNVQGTLVRGVSILKTKYDHQSCPTYRAPHEIERWLGQTERDLERAIAMWRANYWDYALDSACAEYGGCSMLRICKSPQPEDWLPVDFTQRVWDPLARKEMTVKEWEQSWGHES